MINELESIKSWLNFVIQSNDKELTSIISANFGLDRKIKHQCNIENDKIIINFKNRLEGNRFEELLWDEILLYYPRKLPDDICLYLIDKKIAITTLGHTRQSDKIMWILGNYVDEAVLTIGKEIYKSDCYTYNDLKKLLKTFYNIHWLWNSLTFEKASNFEKENLFNDSLKKHPDFNDIWAKKGKRQKDLELRKLLTQTVSMEIIGEYAEKNNPSFNCMIASNPNTPIDLLTKLISVEKGTENSRQIRHYAKENLRKRKK